MINVKVHKKSNQHT